ncbi:phospholipase/carboxylesterase [Cystobacter fuscus]|uniref:Phospholipase/carboxylesterase n=1 Tax=Cystobacter fuscus TaxID=43 RepID=A0A250IXM5_9BACT|nr:luciferase family protein [Cystobacter fuscus]ATB35982.1 phospholipase/carboxylesterase [Cystobacter fuscus]
MTSKRWVFVLVAAQLLVLVACTSATREPPAKEAPAAPATQGVLLETAFRLGRRQGPAPEVSDAPPGTPLAHRQLSQQSPIDMQEALFTRAAALTDVVVAPSGISVPGARAFWLRPEAVLGPRAAFQVGTEFAHIHPAHDGSLHMKFPPGLAEKVYQQGWGAPHPRSGTPMVFGPRDAAELEVVWQLLLRSYVWAHEGQAVDVQVD